MSTETESIKFCCKCSKDVTHIGRMKDSDGRYWCIDCGAKDEDKKKVHAGGVCKGCGESFSKPQLTSIGGLPFFYPCLKKKISVQKTFFCQPLAGLTRRGGF